MATKEGGDCYDYTLWEALRNKHKGDVMERREWKHNFTDGEHHIREYGNGDCVAHTRSFDRAEQIVNDHNQYTALVGQRNLLVAALRFLLKDYEQTYHDLTDGQFEFSGTAIKQARYALATAEQGHEEQAKGGSGGE